MILIKVKDYIQKSIKELKKVNWLSRKETIKLTSEVIVFSLVFIIIYGLIDSILVQFILKFYQ